MTEDSNRSDETRPEIYRRGEAPPLYHGDDGDRISLLRLINIILEHRWKVVGAPLAGAAVLVIATLLWPASYTSQASFISGGGSNLSGQLSQLSGVASQFGLNMPAGQPEQSPQFYSHLLTSDRLLEEAVTTRYTSADEPPRTSSGNGTGSESAGTSDPPGGTVEERAVSVRDGAGGTEAKPAGRTLVELYDIEARTPAIEVTRAVTQLEEALSISTDPETGVVEFSVTTPWPVVSEQVADRLIGLVNQFNNRVRQTQASAEAAFVRERRGEARKELRSAEDSLQTFLQRNVGWQQSPELRFQHDRLQREVSLKQQVYRTLSTRYEEARISEVKSTPVVTTVTHPEVPARADLGHLRLKAALGLLLGGILGLVWAFGAEFAESVREEGQDDFRRFVSLKRDAKEDVKRAGQRIRRLIGGSTSRDAE